MGLRSPLLSSFNPNTPQPVKEAATNSYVHSLMEVQLDGPAPPASAKPNYSNIRSADFLQQQPNGDIDLNFGSRQKHYRRRRSNYTIEKDSGNSQTVQHAAAETMLQLHVASTVENPRANLEDQKTGHVHNHSQEMVDLHDGRQVALLDHRVESNGNHETILHSPIYHHHQNNAVVVHKPRPLTVLSPPAFVPPCLKLLFQQEYDSLVQWHKKNFAAFTEEIQATLGGTLKKYVREYISLLQRATSSNSLPQTRERSGFSGNVRVNFHPTEERTNPDLENISYVSQFKDSSDQQCQIKEIDSLLEAFYKAKDAVISVREASQRIDQHRAWLASELSFTRMELLHLRFSRGINPRGALRQTLELSTTMRSFITELSSALEKNEAGVPWPLSRVADCSDVTPIFIKQLADSLPGTPDKI